MPVNFGKYERDESTLVESGTVLDLVGKTGRIAFVPKNLKDESKRVVVILKKANGESAMVSCSQQVSEGIRNKTIEKGHLLGFNVMEGEEGIPFICMPGGQLLEYTVKEIKLKDYDLSSVNLEDLIA